MDFCGPFPIGETLFVVTDAWNGGTGKEQKEKQVYPAIDPKPLTVSKINGTKVTAQRDIYIITRNISYFKKFKSKREGREIYHAPVDYKSDEDLSDEEIPPVNDQPRVEQPPRHPRRVRNPPRY